jgi:hypothetical protein
MLLAGGLLGFATGCPNTPTSPRRDVKKDEAKQDEVKKDEAKKNERK